MSEGCIGSQTANGVAPGRTQWLTVGQVVAETQYHPDTVRAMLRKGELRGARRGRTWRVRAEDLDRFFHARANVRVTVTRSDPR